jgi:hypothetical protein
MSVLSDRSTRSLQVLSAASLRFSSLCSDFSLRRFLALALAFAVGILPSRFSAAAQIFGLHADFRSARLLSDSRAPKFSRSSFPGRRPMRAPPDFLPARARCRVRSRAPCSSQIRAGQALSFPRFSSAALFPAFGFCCRVRRQDSVLRYWGSLSGCPCVPAEFSLFFSSQSIFSVEKLS